MKVKLIFLLMVSIISCASVSDMENDPEAILKQVVAQYKSIKTYKSKGTIISDLITGKMKMNMKTSFSMKLKKPNLYLISWTKENISGRSDSSTVWNAGNQAYLYMEMMNSYSKMSSDMITLGSATGISGGAAFTIPSLFLSVFSNCPSLFSRLIDPKLEKIEKVEGEKCYVITGSSSISKKETFWISIQKHLIIKYSRDYEQPEGGRKVPEMSDQQLEEVITALGQEVTEETKKRMKDIMEKSKKILKKTNLKGISIELHMNVTSPELNKEDFEFKLPEGVIFKKSLFGDILKTKPK